MGEKAKSRSSVKRNKWTVVEVSQEQKEKMSSIVKKKKKTKKEKPAFVEEVSQEERQKQNSAEQKLKERLKAGEIVNQDDKDDYNSITNKKKRTMKEKPAFMENVGQKERLEQNLAEQKLREILKAKLGDNRRIEQNETVLLVDPSEKGIKFGGSSPVIKKKKDNVKFTNVNKISQEEREELKAKLEANRRKEQNGIVFGKLHAGDNDKLETSVKEEFRELSPIVEKKKIRKKSKEKEKGIFVEQDTTEDRDEQKYAEQQLKERLKAKEEVNQEENDEQKSAEHKLKELLRAKLGMKQNRTVVIIKKKVNKKENLSFEEMANQEREEQNYAEQQLKERLKAKEKVSQEENEEQKSAEQKLKEQLKAKLGLNNRRIESKETKVFIRMQKLENVRVLKTVKDNEVKDSSPSAKKQKKRKKNSLEEKVNQEERKEQNSAEEKLKDRLKAKFGIKRKKEQKVNADISGVSPNKIAKTENVEEEACEEDYDAPDENVYNTADLRVNKSMPKITSAMHESIVTCFDKDDEDVIKRFNINITKKDLYCLTGDRWLNDKVIEFYLQMIAARSSTSLYGKMPTIHTMSTYFFLNLIMRGYEGSIQRWNKDIDIFSFDYVFVPIHLEQHWCLAIIDFRIKALMYYDPMGGDNMPALSALVNYLRQEHLHKKGWMLDMKMFAKETMKEFPQQDENNTADCGMFILKTAEYYSRDGLLSFTQDDMPYFRKRMIWEIMNDNILHSKS